MGNQKKKVTKWENVIIIPVMAELIIWTYKSQFEIIALLISCLLVTVIYNVIYLIRKKELVKTLEKLFN